MNKYQEALVQTQKWLNSEGINYGASYEHTLLKELVDRATPELVKVEIHKYEGEEETINLCPKCKLMVEFMTNFCSHCGKELEWSDSND